MTNSRKQLQAQFWSGLERVFHDRRLEWPSNIPDHCKDFRMGKGITLFLCFLPDTGLLKIGLAMDGDMAQQNFDFLDRSRQRIEAQLGMSLIWDPKPGQKRCSITFEHHAGNLEDRVRWPDHHGWMADLLPRFRSVFTPYIDRM